MRLNSFSERDQNKIVQLAIKRRDDVVAYQGKNVHLPDTINALFICVNKECNKTLDVVVYRSDIINGDISNRIACIDCGGVMNRRYVGVNINHVLNQHMKHVEDYSDKEGLDIWFSEWETE